MTDVTRDHNIADGTVCLEYNVSLKKSILLLLKIICFNFLFESLAMKICSFYFYFGNGIYVDQQWSVSTEIATL